MTRKKPERKNSRPQIERLEDRSTPALVASQFALVPGSNAETLDLLDADTGVNEIDTLLRNAAAATASDDAIIAIVDRGGRILGVRTEAGVSPVITGDPNLLAFAIDGAVSKARTAAFFANNTAPLTSRTIQYISQSTVSEREVNSNPSIPDPTSPLRGPGFVAPVGIGNHFPPGVPFTPQVDLFGIEHTNRDGFVHAGPDRVKGGAFAADDILLPGRFNVPGLTINPPASYGETIIVPAPGIANTFVSRGIATLPGGIPLYENGQLVGGIGVFFPGTTGYATEENSSLSSTFNPALPDRTLEAEFMGLAAAGGSTGAGFKVPSIADFDIPFGRIDLVGITLDTIGPGGNEGPENLVTYAFANLGVGGGNPVSGINRRVTPGGADMAAGAGGDFLAGLVVPDGYLVGPMASPIAGGPTAAEVQQIIEQGIAEANRVRAQIRLSPGPPSTISLLKDDRTRMVFSVTDSAGNVLGLYRMPDATVFSIDVAVAKARNVSYYDDPAQLLAVDQVAGIPAGASFTARTFRFLALPRFPSGIDGSPPGPFSILNDPGINPVDGRNTGAPLPASAYTSVFGFDSFNPGTNFRDTGPAANQNGIVFFPGSAGVYRGGVIIGGFGVSGDGVDEDDVVTSRGISGFATPDALRADQFAFTGVRLPHFKFNRNPER